MPIKIGDRLPDATFKVVTKDGGEERSVAEIFDGKKVVLFGLPGAFTPTCNNNHLPGYLEHLETLKERGVDTVAVVSVNDVFVMSAWASATKGEGKIEYLADGAADFTKAIGMDVDLSAVGMGVRSSRYSMIVENREVKTLNVEEAPGRAITSGAATILEQLV